MHVAVAVTGFVSSRPQVTETRDVAQRADTEPTTSGREATASEGGRSEFCCFCCCCQDCVSSAFTDSYSMNDRNQHYLHRPTLATKVLHNILCCFLPPVRCSILLTFFSCDKLVPHFHCACSYCLTMKNGINHNSL